jgi:hypothetical protein
MPEPILFGGAATDEDPLIVSSLSVPPAFASLPARLELILSCGVNR